MNLIEESFQTKEEKNKKTAIRIVLAAIILVVVIIIGIVSYMAYIKGQELKVSLDGNANNDVKKMLVFENGTVYAPIKKIASYLGYNSYNGEYFEKSESNSKCYVESENEVANFELNSKKIYKLDLNARAENYEYVYSKEAVKAIGGELYASADAIEKAFNVSFQYNEDRNTVQIFTLPYLVNFYNPYVLNWGYVGISEEFANQKAILKNMLVVTNNNKRVGVLDTEGKSILEVKYSNITYLSSVGEGGDFLVEDNGKVGVMSKNRETKIQLIYDSIELLDLDAGLYVAKKDNKYGVLDFRGKVIIYIENDEIGVDISRFKENGIKNKYILAENLIPARKDRKWGLYDTKGNLLVDYQYDSLGYTATSSRNALSLLVIPDYNVIVACKDKKYTLLNSIGEELFSGPVADDIYMTIDGGEKHYYIRANDQEMDAEEYLNQIDVNPRAYEQNSTTRPQTNQQQTEEDNNEQNNDEQNFGEEQNSDEQNNNEQNGEEQNNDGENQGNQDFQEVNDQERGQE